MCCYIHNQHQVLHEGEEAIVGEIRLDGARWVEVAADDFEDDNYQNDMTTGKNSTWDRSRTLACPMDLQKDAFVKQLLFAAELNRRLVFILSEHGENYLVH